MMKKLTLLVLLFCFVGKLSAQDTTNFNMSFNHLALSVKDVELSAEFYTSVMKLTQISNRTKIEGIRWFSMGEGRELHLISIVSGEIVITKAVHLALTTPNFNGFVALLDKKGIVYSDWSGEPHTVNIRADGIQQVFFQDPDGYWLEVNSVAQK